MSNETYVCSNCGYECNTPTYTNSTPTYNPAIGNYYSEIDLSNMLKNIQTTIQQELIQVYSDFVNNISNTVSELATYNADCCMDVRVVAFITQGKGFIEDLDVLKQRVYDKAINKARCVEQNYNQGNILDEVAFVDQIFATVDGKSIVKNSTKMINKFKEEQFKAETLCGVC